MNRMRGVVGNITSCRNQYIVSDGYRFSDREDAPGANKGPIADSEFGLVEYAPARYSERAREAHIVTDINLHWTGDVRKALHLQSLADGSTHRSKDRKSEASDLDPLLDVVLDKLQKPNGSEERVEGPWNRDVECENSFADSLQSSVERRIGSLYLQDERPKKH
jgi:hypothetical protein